MELAPLVAQKFREPDLVTTQQQQSVQISPGELIQANADLRQLHRRTMKIVAIMGMRWRKRAMLLVDGGKTGDNAGLDVDDVGKNCGLVTCCQCVSRFPRF